MGGTMRLGSYTCQLKRGSTAAQAYGSTTVQERHRHRYEFNGAYAAQFEEAGMSLAGTNPDTKLVEVVEVKGHPFFVGVQYHPEYKSTVLAPHPLFVGLIHAALQRREGAQKRRR